MLQEELDGMPARSEALEKEQAELEQRLADPDLFQPGSRALQRYDETHART